MAREIHTENLAASMNLKPHPWRLGRVDGFGRYSTQAFLVIACLLTYHHAYNV